MAARRRPGHPLELTPAIHDERAADALDLLRSQRKPHGRWPLQKRIPGTLLVEMEKPGGESRWNTLRALRILRAAEGGPHTVAPSTVALSNEASSPRGMFGV